MGGIGWVIDDGCAPKREAGGATEFARQLAESDEYPRGHAAACDACRLLGEDLACVGVVAPLLSADAEEWLAGRLPDDIDSLPGVLLRKNLQEGGVEGQAGRALRKLSFLEAPGPFSRHWGPFFRRYTVTTDQLLEEMFGAGDVQPAHALGVLVHLGGILIDGERPVAPAAGSRLAELMQKPDERRERALCTFGPAEAADGAAAADDDRSLRELKRYLRALYAAFVLDCEVKVLAPV